MKILKSLFHQPEQALKTSVPEIIPIRREMTQVEREKIRDWLDSPETQMALGFLESKRPTVWPGHTHADVRLYQLQGWEMFRDTLLSLTHQDTPQEVFEESFQKPDIL